METSNRSSPLTERPIMRDYLNIGCTPSDEPCAQVGQGNYQKQSMIEVRVFAHQCQRVLAANFPEVLVNVAGKSFPHDFGTYREVVVYYDDDDQKQVEQAFFLESVDLSNWDEEALQELTSYNYTLHLE